MNHRYDFIYLFDCADANPNGDPDAGNLPRLDTETGQGLVTDVCLKRKIRNYIQLIHQPPAKDQSGMKRGHDIYVRERAVLNHQHQRAYDAEGVKATKGKLPKEVADAQKVKNWMCGNFFDIRTFGAVMTTDVNCGQVRGPVQIAFSRSIDPVVTTEHAVTRMAVTTENEAEKQQGDNRTMGRKFTIPYALYRTHGTVNPFLAAQTGFTEDGDDSDLETLFQALEHAFDFDASAARPAGSMAARGLLVFKHENQLGKTPSHTLFDSVSVRRKDGMEVPRSFSDYEVTVDESALPEGVTLIRRI